MKWTFGTRKQISRMKCRTPPWKICYKKVSREARRARRELLRGTQKWNKLVLFQKDGGLSDMLVERSCKVRCDTVHLTLACRVREISLVQLAMYIYPYLIPLPIAISFTYHSPSTGSDINFFNDLGSRRSHSYIIVIASCWSESSISKDLCLIPKRLRKGLDTGQLAISVVQRPVATKSL
jgi:hypothetical protein